MKNSLKTALLGLLLVPTLALAGCSCKKENNDDKSPSSGQNSSLVFTRAQMEEAYAILHGHVKNIIERKVLEVGIHSITTIDQSCIAVSATSVSQSTIDGRCLQENADDTKKQMGYDLTSGNSYYIESVKKSDSWSTSYGEYIVGEENQFTFYKEDTVVKEAYDANENSTQTTIGSKFDKFDWFNVIFESETLAEFKQAYIATFGDQSKIKTSNMEFKVEDNLFKLIFKIEFNSTDLHDLNVVEATVAFNSSGVISVKENKHTNNSGSVVTGQTEVLPGGGNNNDTLLDPNKGTMVDVNYICNEVTEAVLFGTMDESFLEKSYDGFVKVSLPIA